jgi:radical S-adenosyl methionine domain-containing protein 2
LERIKSAGIYKINFAGGEPLLNKNTGEYIKYAKDIGLKTSIISNASLMTNGWLNKYGQYTDQIGISCDSLDDTTNQSLGRGFGNHVDITKRALRRINQLKTEKNINIKTKLNTVVLRANHHEDWNMFIEEYKIDRWKVFKILKIVGENDHVYDDLSINDKQFTKFIGRHSNLLKKGILVKENNDDMEMSYIMITPDGRFYQNQNNEYVYSDSILDMGFKATLEQTGFDCDKFDNRGGSYDL